MVLVVALITRYHWRSSGSRRYSHGDGVKGVWELFPSWGAGAEPLLRVLGAKLPRSWSINTFCVTVKAFS